MDIKIPHSCLLFVFLCVIGASTSSQLAPIQPFNTTINGTAEPPPNIFPKEPYSDEGSEVPDLLNSTITPKLNPESETVDHPKTIDPGTTHQEGGMPPRNDTVTNKTNESLEQDNTNMNSTKNENTTNSNATKEVDTRSNSTVEKEANDTTTTTTPKPGAIYTCIFPKSWLKERAGKNNNTSIENSTDNTEKDTNTCSFPPDWFKEESSNSTFHICTIHKEWLRANNYTIQNGTIPVELLTHMNTDNFSCVTPGDAFKDDYDITTNYTSVPQGWIKEGNDIYIYLIPEDNNVTGAEPDIVSTQNTNSTGELTAISESIATSTSNPGLARVNLTGEVTHVNFLNNSGIVNSTLTDNNSTVPSIMVESATQKDISANSSGEAETPLKMNTPTQEDISENEHHAQKSKVHENDDKNKTQDQDTSAETSSPDVAENVIDGESTTPSSPAALLQKHADHDHSSSSGKTAFLQPTESAAILAGVFVGIALLGYVGLLVWRRILERRYGNREMLVNEDDDFDTSDMRHFEMQNTRSSSVIQFK